MELLHNNIEIPSRWPPEHAETTLDKPLPVPYLEKKPPVINIALGRQLFVDDFLIAETDLRRECKNPVIGTQPVFQPETALEMNDGYCPCACPFGDGLFYDDQAGKFKMWYHAGWFDGIAYAESDDGVHWKRLHQLDPSRADDRVIPHEFGAMRDGAAVWLDYAATDPGERYKMLVFYRQFDVEVKYYHRKPKHRHDVPGSVPPVERTVLYKSANGIDWQEVGETGHCGDNSHFFHNPFRKKWVFSLRTFSSLDCRIRTRGYFETDDFFAGRRWLPEDVAFWSRTDIYDAPDTNLGYYTQLYGLDATPYESLMLGVYSVFMGPPNSVCEILGMPKINDLKLGYSRDGFHWSRPTHGDFIASSRKKGTWDYGYMHAVNGGCCVVGDEIFFYYSCFSGASPQFGTHKYAGGNLGLAKLRRDGFACLRDDGKGGSVTTEKLAFSGDRLFINCVSPDGSVGVEILDSEGRTIEGFSADDCIPLSVDSTRVRVEWKKSSLADLQGKTIRLRFRLHNAELYSFWITGNAEGRSGGYMAAGGPGFNQGRDS
jgi:hypothetical protein